MGIWQSLSAPVRRAVRYKLLVLVLFPIVLALPVALALAVYWGGRFGYDQLFIKVRTDLSVATDVFERAQADYLDALAQLAGSYSFRVDFNRDDRTALERDLDRIRAARGFAELRLADRQGRILERDHGSAEPRWIRPSLLVERALLGEPSVGIEVLPAELLRLTDPTLSERIRLGRVDTPRSEPSGRGDEDRSMLIRALQPVHDANGNVRAVLDGSVVLDGNFEFVDAIRDLVYGPGRLPKGSVGAVTLFLDDVPISTNLPMAPGEPTLGARASEVVREQVLGRGEPWVDRAFVVDDWYISGYAPILDAAGKRAGMLHTGFLEAPFRADLTRALVTLLLLFLGLALVTGVLAVLGAKSIFKPLESMSRVIDETRAGRDCRIGPIASEDEIGELSREFDAMLDQLKSNADQIKSSAELLEIKVGERTAELKRRNHELERTVRLLRDTRRQLVEAEKLAALGELTAGMAHEINNPMAVILGNLDLMAHELGAAAGPVRQEIDLIVEQVYRVRDIIDSLLRYARPVDSEATLERVDVNDVVRESLKLVGHLARGADSEVPSRLEATREVRIGRQDLQQVIVNLLVNAMHAVEADAGRLEVSTRDWEGIGVVIAVRDSGPGVPAELADKVFAPFFTTKGVGEGTGLGLSVSLGLIRRYGGNITVESRPGEGAEFRVWVRAEPELDADDTRLAESLASATPGR